MKKNLTALVFLCLILVSSRGFTQDYRGIWQGYISDIDGRYYNTDYTLDVKTQEGNVVTGRGYIFSEHWQTHESTLDFIGDISKNTLRITELSVVKSITTFPRHTVCIKFADLKFSTKNNVDYLTGNWNGSTEEETDCIPGRVYLKRVSVGQSMAVTDSIPEIVMREIRQDKSTAIAFRETVLTKPVVIDVNTRLIFLEITDYLKPDNDTVSVYYNRRLIINRLGIKKQTFTFPLRLDRQSGLNEIIMYANNLGAIPPNTSELIIRDGKGNHKVLIESTKQTSAVIYLRYVPSKSL